MKKILMIGTGGTIASEMTPEGPDTGLTPTSCCPIFPASPSCAMWTASSCTVWTAPAFTPPTGWGRPNHPGALRRLRRFVISHGTDTMAYTAAALSYLVQDSPKPIILTGARSPSGSMAPTPSATSPDAFSTPAGLRRRADLLTGRVILGTVPARPTPRASGPSPVSTTPIWRWCRTSICYSTSVVRAGHGPCSMTVWIPMWGC